MNYWILYIKIIPKFKHLNWIKYCNIFEYLPIEIKNKIIQICASINYKYDFKVPLSYDNNNGIITDLENIDEISFEIYNKYLKEFSEYFNVRCVYTYGPITKLGQSIHDSKGDGLIFLGRNLDLIDTQILTKLYYEY